MTATFDAGSDSAVLGQFLELSLTAEPLAPAAQFYESVGFRAVPTGDALRHPYVAFADGDVAIGLHARDAPSPALTFVRPELKTYVRALRRLRVALDERHLADDEFNRVSFADPSGQPVVLLEARTFAPAAWDRQNVTACGSFLEYSVATDDVAAAGEFWQALGLAVVHADSAPHASVRLAGRGIVLGFHAAHFRPGLSFRAPQLDARRAYLRAKGWAPRDGAPPLDAAASAAATLVAPDGTPLYLFDVD